MDERIIQQDDTPRDATSIDSSDNIRLQNPFRDLLVTELIEDPKKFQKVFSEQILVGEALDVFTPKNIVLLGPQGVGKSMILNLVRYKVIAECISENNVLPPPLNTIPPFFGISINLLRANVHAFGRRSISKVINNGVHNPIIEVTCAADFINHYLFGEILNGVKYLLSENGKNLRNWMRIDNTLLSDRSIASKFSQLQSWNGFYNKCNSLCSLEEKCYERLNTWRDFLNINIDEIPKKIWKTKSQPGIPLHEIGNVLHGLTINHQSLPIFVVIDQYEVLPELNPSYGTELQKMVNTYIKARDPVVFYKVGSRTHDWGNELRIVGAESRIERFRDYDPINLGDLLMRKENTQNRWIFPRFARDVAHKRMLEKGFEGINENTIQTMLGNWNAYDEAEMYFDSQIKNTTRKLELLKVLPDYYENEIIKAIGIEASSLEFQLAKAWTLQQINRKITKDDIIASIRNKMWNKSTWTKERKQTALLQLASKANEKKLYYGWDSIKYLSGYNISAFLVLCGEIWDAASKVGVNPIQDTPIAPKLQTDGVNNASRRWLLRDENEIVGGRARYNTISKLGKAIRNNLIADEAMSNPGHTGFSLIENDLFEYDMNRQLETFLRKAVNWAIFEERPHTSKNRNDPPRRKWYLHPILSANFGIPFKRVKEPFYVDVDTVHKWFFENKPIIFGTAQKNIVKRMNKTSKKIQSNQSELYFGDK